MNKGMLKRSRFSSRNLQGNVLSRKDLLRKAKGLKKRKAASKLKSQNAVSLGTFREDSKDTSLPEVAFDDGEETTITKKAKLEKTDSTFLKKKRKNKRQPKSSDHEKKGDAMVPELHKEMETSASLNNPSDGSELEADCQWEELGIPSPILEALRETPFAHPTEIQRLAIPQAISQHYDIIGAAETVS